MSRSPSLRKRRNTLKKKAQELSTLCGIDVAYVCFEPNGTPHTWPEDQEKVKEIILKYREVKSRENPSASVSASSSSPGSSGTTHNNGGGREIVQEEVQEEVAELETQVARMHECSLEELFVLHRLAGKKAESLRGKVESLESNAAAMERRLQRLGSGLKTANLINLVGFPSENSGAGQSCLWMVEA